MFETFLYPIIFYAILITVYFYSAGKFNVSKKEAYIKWVKSKGRRVSKAVIILGVLYSVFLILQLLSLL